eukprot:3799549-Rhodomonas_salina.1
MQIIWAEGFSACAHPLTNRSHARSEHTVSVVYDAVVLTVSRANHAGHPLDVRVIRHERKEASGGGKHGAKGDAENGVVGEGLRW